MEKISETQSYLRGVEVLQSQINTVPILNYKHNLLKNLIHCLNGIRKKWYVFNIKALLGVCVYIYTCMYVCMCVCCDQH